MNDRYSRRAVVAMTWLGLAGSTPVTVNRSSGTLPITLSPRASSHIARRDLAALVPSPDELDGIGLLGFGLERGAYGAPADVLPTPATPDVATPVGAGEDDGRNHYRLTFVRPSEADPIMPAARLSVGLTDVRSPELAATLSRTLAPDDTDVVRVLVLAGSKFDPIELTARVLVAPVVMPEYQEPVTGVTAVVTVGQIVVTMELADATAAEPDPAAVLLVLQSLADRLLAAEPADDALSGRVVEVPDGGRAFAFTDDKYELLDGVPRRLARESDVGLVSRVESYGGATDVFSRYRALDANDVTPDDDPYAVIRLLWFPDAVAASNYLMVAAENVSATGGAYERIARVEGAAMFGDASVTYEYRFRASPAVRLDGYVIFVQVGEIVARVQLDSQPGPELAVVESLARAQAMCVADGSCVTPSGQ